MQLKEIIDKVNLKPLTKLEDREVKSVFMSDMLSDVMTSAEAESLWVTVQTHSNIVSAANLVDIAAVVVSQGKKVPEATIELANRYHVVILSAKLSNFELANKLIEIGLKT
jgi:serine kinase of HPr protein (carbohydrate metabolism regulator)